MTENMAEPASVIEQEQRRQLQKIRQQLADLESGGLVIDV